MKKVLSDDDLLDLAKGVGTNMLTESAQQAKSLLESKQYWTAKPSSTRELIVKRKEIRSTLFKILKIFNKERVIQNERVEHNKMLHLLNINQLSLFENIIEQMDANLGMFFEDFTFVWDLSPTEPWKVIRKEQWFASGGKVDNELGVYSPSAFTQQEIS